jgi:AcrR family transcriptional regulator
MRERADRYSAAQRRTIDAALDLFADHGVAGTSLQMIADALGVTKAAVYHQFKTKDTIVQAVLEVTLEQIEAALEVAEASGGGLRARETLLDDVVGVAVDRRRAVGALQNDPVMVRVLGDYEPSRRLWSRLFAVLLGEDLDAAARVRAAALSAAIGSVGHPFVADLDDDTLRRELLALTRRLVMLPG